MTNCPKCGGDMWDNRQKKKNPKAPDFKCKDKNCDGVIWPPKEGEFQKAKAVMQQPANVPQAPPARPSEEDGVERTRRRLMQASNLQAMCIRAVENYTGLALPEVARTAEQYQALIGQLFIHLSKRVTDDGVNWYSYVDFMPTTPIKQ